MEVLFIFIVVGGLVGLVIYFLTSGGDDTEAKNAEAAYKQALQELENNPFDTNLLKDTLEKGRKHYYFIMPDKRTVNGHGHTVFSTDNAANRETMIQNDISVRTSSKKAEKKPTDSKFELSAEIEKLAALKEKGLISAEEYKIAKEKILK